MPQSCTLSSQHPNLAPPLPEGRVSSNNRVSQSVPHLHAHVVPRRKKDGLKGFFWPRYTYSGEEEITKVRDAITGAMAS